MSPDRLGSTPIRNRDAYRRLVVIPGSALIALIGIYWTFQRLPLP